MKKYKNKPWTERERSLLREYYHVLSQEALLDILPGRTHRAIVSQVFYLTKRGQHFAGASQTR